MTIGIGFPGGNDLNLLVLSHLPQIHIKIRNRCRSIGIIDIARDHAHS